MVLGEAALAALPNPSRGAALEGDLTTAGRTAGIPMEKESKATYPIIFPARFGRRGGGASGQLDHGPKSPPRIKAALAAKLITV